MHTSNIFAVIDKLVPGLSDAQRQRVFDICVGYQETQNDIFFYKNWDGTTNPDVRKIGQLVRFEN